MRPDVLEFELAELYRRQELLQEQWDDALNDWLKLDLAEGPVYGQEREELDARMSMLMSENLEIWREIQDNQACYRRPRGMISGLFSRMLAPLPHRLSNTRIDARARETMASLPSYRFTAFMTFVGVIATVFTVATVFPWLMVSPLSLVLSIGGVGGSTQSMTSYVILTVLSIIILLTIIKMRQNAWIVVYDAAHEEEKWYRAGAENWNMRQRVASCFAFGACHVVNIFYPFVTCLALCLVGAVFMAVYLAEYRRSGDVYRATMASTKMHARYNIYAFMLILVVFVAFVVSSVLL